MRLFLFCRSGYRTAQFATIFRRSLYTTTILILLSTAWEVSLMLKGICLFLCVVISMSALATPAAAQGTADIVGRVTDSSGAILPGVTVTARHLATNVTRTTVTGETGDYSFTALSIGEYEVKS